jgi:hypothetical protein
MTSTVILKDRIMGLNTNHRISLMFKTGVVACALVLFLRGKPPAQSQYPDDKQHDAAISRLLDHDDQQREINKETDDRLNHLTSVVDTLGGEIIGGFGMITVLGGLAVFFQLKGKGK